MVYHGDLRYLAAIFCLYTFYEFFVKRLFWKPGLNVSWIAVMLQAATYAGILCIGSAGFLSLGLAVWYIIVAASRTLIDVSLRKRTSRRSLERFIFIQTITAVFLTAVWYVMLPIHVYDWCSQWEAWILGNLGGIGIYLQHSGTIVLLVASAYFFMVDGGAAIVRGILGKFPLLMEKISGHQNNNNENRGEWIGVLERIITLTFVLTGNYTAVAFALAAKSIARFKELEEKEFAEYYLLGTFSSLATAISIGALIQFLIKIL